MSGATGYDVYRGTSSGGETLLSAGTNVSSSTFTDSTAVNGTQYFYYVTALNGSLQSGKSNEVSATPQAPQPGSLVLAISAGGPAAGSFVADTDFSGGTVSGRHQSSHQHQWRDQPATSERAATRTLRQPHLHHPQADGRC